jgi:hypothetical protein
MGRTNEVNEERGYTGDWERGMSRGNYSRSGGFIGDEV